MIRNKEKTKVKKYSCFWCHCTGFIKEQKVFRKLVKMDGIKDKEIFLGPENYPLKIEVKTFKVKKYIDFRKWYQKNLKIHHQE